MIESSKIPNNPNSEDNVDEAIDKFSMLDLTDRLFSEDDMKYNVHIYCPKHECHFPNCHKKIASDC